MNTDFKIVKLSLIALTILNTILSIVKYHFYAYGWGWFGRHQYYDSSTNTNTTIDEFAKQAFDKHLIEKLPSINCNATNSFEAVYNIIFLIIIIKEVLKGVSIFYILEISLFCLSALTMDSFRKALWRIFYIMFVYTYWNVLKNKMEVKEWQIWIRGLQARLEPNIDPPSLAA